MDIRIAGITNESVVDGPGIRITIFTQGCPHHCPGCHNPDTWDPNGGRLMKVNEVKRMINRAHLTSRSISGITLSGGEPLLQAEPLIEIVRWYKRFYPGTVILYTGYVLEDILRNVQPSSPILTLVNEVSLLIDGPYQLHNRYPITPWKGSNNQKKR